MCNIWHVVLCTVLCFTARGMSIAAPLFSAQIAVYGIALSPHAFDGLEGVNRIQTIQFPIPSTFISLYCSDTEILLDEGFTLSLGTSGPELKGEGTLKESVRVDIHKGLSMDNMGRIDIVFIDRILSQIASEVSKEHWMGDLRSMEECEGCLGSLTLAEVALPGTHDSGTFNLTTESTVPPDEFAELVDEACVLLNILGIDIDCTAAVEVANKLTVPWAVTETTGWTGQLLAGGRSFDYRGYYEEESDIWVIEHSVIGSVPNTTAVMLAQEVRAFLDSHQGEIIIIEYKCQNGNCTDLADRFLTHLGPYGYHWTKGVVIPGNPTLAEMVRNDMRAIVVQENGGQRSNVTVGIMNDYPDSCNLTEILSYDSEAIQLFASEDADAMRKIGYQATADVECIVRGFVGQLLEHDSNYCVPFIGFDCSICLLGYIDQLDQYFTLEYVLDAYALVKPISQAQYFGNLWNVDNIMPRFADVIIALNALLLVNDAVAP